MTAIETLPASLYALRTLRDALQIKLQKIDAGIAGIEAILEDEVADAPVRVRPQRTDTFPLELVEPPSKLADFIMHVLQQQPGLRVIEIARLVMAETGNDNENSMQSRVSRILNENADHAFIRTDDRRWYLSTSEQEPHSGLV